MAEVHVCNKALERGERLMVLLVASVVETLQQGALVEECILVEDSVNRILMAPLCVTPKRRHSKRNIANNKISWSRTHALQAWRCTLVCMLKATYTPDGFRFCALHRPLKRTHT